MGRGAPLFSSGAFRCDEMAPAEVPRLQRFFEANPEYFLAVEGAPPGPDAGREAYGSKPPAEWPWDRKIVLGFEDASGALVAMADVIANLFSKGIWHVGLYIVATPLHGTGAARTMYQAMESWMRSQGADWSRLNVVVGNARAERFWRSMEYMEVRQRHGVEMGRRTHDLRVMVKPLTGRGMDDYFARVKRDAEPA